MRIVDSDAIVVADRRSIFVPHIHILYVLWVPGRHVCSVATWAVKEFLGGQD